MALIARQQLARIERLRQVIVGAEIEPDDPVDVVATGRQHQHGRLRARLAQLLQHVEARESGQHDVEDDQIEILALGAAQSGDSRRHGRELYALGRKVFDQHLGETHVVVDDQEAMVGHGPRLRYPEKVPQKAWRTKGYSNQEQNY